MLQDRSRCYSRLLWLIGKLRSTKDNVESSSPIDEAVEKKTARVQVAHKFLEQNWLGSSSLLKAREKKYVSRRVFGLLFAIVKKAKMRPDLMLTSKFNSHHHAENPWTIQTSRWKKVKGDFSAPWSGDGQTYIAVGNVLWFWNLECDPPAQKRRSGSIQPSIQETKLLSSELFGFRTQTISKNEKTVWKEKMFVVLYNFGHLQGHYSQYHKYHINQWKNWCI